MRLQAHQSIHRQLTAAAVSEISHDLQSELPMISLPPIMASMRKQPICFITCRITKEIWSEYYPGRAVNCL